MKDFWNERFGSSDYFYGKGPNQFLKESASKINPHSKILCLGEGEGRNAVYLASLGHTVTAVDLSDEGKKKAELLAQEKQVNLDYVLSDLADFNFGENKWDVVISIFCHLPTAIRELVHKNVYTSLKEGGQFIIQSYNPEQLKYNSGGPKDPQMLYTQEILLKDFPLFKWTKLDNSMDEIFEGRGHQGLSSLLSGIGVK
jgi:2-polyprenyl-3-methyl-5-hydroxy-6-metoxy-1,4-benzoquinol methylase